MTDIDQVAKLEGEIREFVRGDAASPRRMQRSKADTAADPIAENLNALIGRVADASTEEIDRVILKLQGVRNMLRGEGERVSRDIVGYANSNQATMSVMKVINDSLKQWKDGRSDRMRAIGGSLTVHAGESLQDGGGAASA
jgi:hypothetical protein